MIYRLLLVTAAAAILMAGCTTGIKRVRNAAEDRNLPQQSAECRQDTVPAGSEEPAEGLPLDGKKKGRPQKSAPESRESSRRDDAFTLRCAMKSRTREERSGNGIPAEPEGQLTLRRAVALALCRNPDLKAFGFDVRAAEARMVEAGLWSNPESEFEIDEFGGTGGLAAMDAAEFTVSLAQTFPLGEDIAHRRELAGRRVEVAGWEYEAARIEVLTDVTRRFVRLLSAQRQLEIAEEERELAEAVLSTARKRFEAGAAAELEVIRARVPAARAKVHVRRWQRRVKTARRQLALTWGQRRPMFKKAVGDLEQVNEPPDPKTLASLISRNPRVARWAAKISARRAEAELARAEAVPDVTGRMGVKRFNEIDETALVVGISLPIPIFDRNQGAIRAAELEAGAAEQRKREAERRLETQLSTVWTRLADAWTEAEALREEALPPAAEAFAVTRSAFEEGDIAFIDVLLAERTLVDLRSRYVTALADYHQAAAEIEGLIGCSLSDIMPPDGKPAPGKQEKAGREKPSQEKAGQEQDGHEKAIEENTREE